MQAYFPSNNVQAPEPDSLVGRIRNKVDRCVQSVSEWKDKQEKYYKMRMRIKKDKTFPFKGSSNLRMPTADTYIRKTKSGILNATFGIRPILQAVPSPSGNPQTAQNIEKFLDHLIVDVMKFKNKAAIIVDQTVEKGMFLAKPYWRLEICDRVVTVQMADFEEGEKQAILQMPVEEIIPYAIKQYQIDMGKPVREHNMESVIKAVMELKSGKEKAVINFKDVVYNAPDVAVISPEKVFVPTYSGFHPQTADFLTHEYYLSLDTIAYRAEYMGWNKKAVEELQAIKRVDTKDDSIDLKKDEREGISQLQEDGLVKIHEFYGYEDIGNGKKEKVLVTYAPSFNIELRKIKWETFTKKYPFIKFFYELTDDRWFSHRGVPEMLEDIIKEIDTQHNMKIDQQTIRNAPMFVYRSGMVNPNMVQMRPNQAIPVKGTMALGDAVQALNFHNPAIEYSYEREQQLLESKCQELLGQSDFSLQSQVNRREPRTLGEVQMQQAAYNGIFGMDVAMFTESFTELFNMIFELWCENGDDEYEFTYFGNNGAETIKLNREEIQNQYTLTVRGNDANTNPNTKLQKAQQIIMTVTNPVLMQNGVVTPQNQVEGIKEFFKALDIEGAERFFMPQPQPMNPPPPPVAALIKPKFSDLKDSEQAQVLQSVGVQADMPVRGYDRERRDASEEAEIAKQIVESMS
jgi:hypothetical protein